MAVNDGIKWKDWNTNPTCLLRTAAPPELLESFRRAVPAIAAFFPWLAEYVGVAREKAA